MNETQKGGRSTYGSPAPLSREQMQQQMQAAFQDGSNRPRKKKQPEQRRISDMPNGKPAQRGKRGNQPEPMPRSVGQAKAEKLRQIKASVASASQGFIMKKRHLQPQLEAHRYVHRRSSAPPPPVPPRNRNSRPQEPEYYGGSDVASSGKGGKIAGIIVLVLVVLLLIGYLIGYFSYRSKLLPKTYVNGVNVSGMTLADAEQKILNSASNEGITFIKKRVAKRCTLMGQNLDRPFLSKMVQWMKSPARAMYCGFTHLLHKSEYTVSVVNSYSESNLSNLILSYSWGTTPPTDAHIQKASDGTYSIVPEDNGDMIDATILMNYTLEQMREGNNTIKLEDADCYLQAEVKSEDLQAALDAANSLAGLTITYDFDDRQEVLDTSTIADWITTDTDGKFLSMKIRSRHGSMKTW